MLPVRVRALRWVATTAACLMVAGLVSASPDSRSRVDLVDQPVAPTDAAAVQPGEAEPALPVQVTPGPVEYAHDAAGRLVGATQPAGDTARYEYDEAGNLLQIERYASTDVSVLSLVPARAPEGAEVTVTGTGFAHDPADNTVAFAGVTAGVTSASATELVVAVPVDAVNGPVTVTTPSGSASSPEGFVVERATPQPEVSGFSPAIGAPGTSVTISGTGFDPDPDANVVRFEQTRAQVSAATTTSMTVEVPQAAGSGPVTVKTAGGMGVSAGRFVVPPPDYEAGDVGDVVTVTADTAPVSLDLAAGSVGLVVFTGVAGQRLGLGFTEATFSDPFQVGAFTPTGKPFARDQFDALATIDGAGSLALTPLPIDGTYQVLVVPANPVAGIVDVSLSNATTGVLDPVAGTGFTLDRPGEYAELSWSAPANQLLQMSAGDWSFSSSTLLRIIVFDPHGARRADQLVTENRELFFVTSTAGQYRVQVYSWFASTGSGTMQVVEPTDVGSVDIDGDPVVVPVSSSELTALRFTATAGAWVDFGFTNWDIGSFGSLRGWVIGPDGAVLADRPGFVEGDSIPVRARVSGEHRLVLTGRGDAAGSLTVTASSQLDGGALMLDTPVTVSTDRPGQSIGLRFAGQAGQRLAMVLDSYSFAFTPRLRVLGPDGEQLAIEHQLSQLPLDPLPVAGEYTFVVDGFSSVGTAQLRLESAIDAGPITTDGASVSLTLDAPGEVGVFTFTAQDGQNLSFGFTDSTFNNADPPRMTVLKLDGLAPREADWLVGFDSAIDMEVRDDGEHTLLVGAPQGLTGEITVTLSLQQDLGVLEAGSPQPITVDRPGQGLRFQVEGVAGQGLFIELSHLAFTYLPRVTVYLPGGIVVVDNPATSSIYLEELQFTGAYLVTVSPYAGTGTATLKLWRHTDSSLVVDGASGSATFDAGDAYVFAFHADAGQRLGFGFSGWTLPGSAQLRVFMVTPDGRFPNAANWLLPQHSTFELTTDVAGAHRLFVAAADNVSIGSVTAAVSTEVDAGSIAVGQSRTVTVARPGQPVRLHFSGTAGAQRQLAFSNFTTMFLPRVTVHLPDGSVLAQNPAAITMNFTLPVTGTYDVVITTYSSTGSMTAALNAGSPAATAGDAVPAGMDQGGTPVPVAEPRQRSGTDTPIGAAAPAPRGIDVPAAEEVGRPGIEATRPMLEPRRAPEGVTAVSGEVRSVDDRPLAGVSVSIGHRRTGTNADGQFLLVGVPTGQQRLVIDGDRVGGVSYGSYDVGVDVAPGQTTVLPALSWLTPIDPRHTVEFDSPTSEPVVLSHPDVPGLEVRIPAGTTVTDRAGKVVTELGITPIRVDRPPFPLPGFPVPVYFTVQPGGVHLSGAGGQIIYPNYTGAPAGTPADFWHYDPAGRGWYRYGNGQVSADGTRVVPDEYVRVRDLTGAMINDPAQPLPPEQAPPPGGNATGGDPVDLATGLMVEQQTDLWLDDVLPIGVSRTYRQDDVGSHAFGVGTSLDEFGLRLFSVRQWEDAALILPDGGRVQFTRITPGVDTFEDAVFAAEPTPTRFQGSILAWNGNGWDLRLRNGLTYVFGDEAPLQSIRDQHGNTTTITRAPGVPFDGFTRANGPITQITSPSGKWIRFGYDDENRIIQAVDNLGRTVAYTYHETGVLAGHLAAVTNPDGGTTEYGYETYQDDGVARARLTSITDPRGITYLTNAYDTAGRVAVQTQADGSTYQFAYTEVDGRITSTVVTDPRGQQRKVTFDASGYTTSDTAAVGTPEQQQLLIERDPQTHQPVATADALGRRTDTVYDANGNPASVTRLAGTAQAQTVAYAHDGPLDQLTRVTDPLGHVTSLTYREDGALASVTDPAGRTTTFAADPAGRLTGITDPLGNTTTLDYQAGDLVSVTDPVGRDTQLAMDTAGRVTAATDPAGNTTRYTYDPLSQTRSVTDPLGQVTGLDYDPNGNLTAVTDPRGNTTSYGYDTMDRVESHTDPLGRVETYGYDPGGNLTSVDSRRGNRTEYTYDPLGRLVQARHGVTPTGQESQVTYTYDPGNRLVGVDDTAGGALAYTFDGLDRLTQETTPAGTVTYGYDDADRRTSMTVAGQDPVTYGYNDAGDLLTIAQGVQQVGHSYDGAGRIDTVTLPGGWAQDYTYDPADQLIGIAYRHDGTLAGDLVYDYHPSGLRKRDSGSWARNSLPDPFGPAAYDPANQIDTVDGTVHTYDPDGNLTDDGTLAYGYNARNQLTNLTSMAGGGASFSYDGLGRRTAATIDGITRGYLYDGDNPVQELDAAAQPTANLLTGGLDVYYTRTTTAGTDTYLTDMLGSTTALGAADGTVPAEYTYQPFGATTLTGDDQSNRHQYTGRENDGTGLYHYRNRYYHPTLQRFSTEDPVGFAGGDINLYAYVGNRPTEYVDPYGEKPRSPHILIDQHDLPALEIDAKRMPNIARNIQDALDEGHPGVLNRTTDRLQIRSNRRAACSGFCGPGSPDEYPFASTTQGGAGARVAGVSIAEQRIQGGVLARFYAEHRVGHGDPFRVVVVGLVS